MAKGKKKSPPKTCTKQVITFTRKRGGRKVISFTGRTGGKDRNGGKCKGGPKPSTQRLKPWKDAMGKAARACKGKSKGAFRKCVGARLRAV